jgi:hypothetical protein
MPRIGELGSKGETNRFDTRHGSINDVVDINKDTQKSSLLHVLPFYHGIFANV